MGCIWLVVGGWAFDKNFHQWTSINISVQDLIIAIFVLIAFTTFGTCCCQIGRARRGRGRGTVTGRGKWEHISHDKEYLSFRMQSIVFYMISHYIIGIWQTLLSRVTYNKVQTHNQGWVHWKTREGSTISSAEAITKIRTWAYSINLTMEYGKTFFDNATRYNVKVHVHRNNKTVFITRRK